MTEKQTKATPQKKRKSFWLLIFVWLCALVCVGLSIGKKSSQTAANVTPETLQTGKDSSLGAPLQMLTLRGGAKAVTAGSAGFYYAGNDAANTILYYDEAMQTSVPLCNRPDCPHNGTDCTAYVENGVNRLFMNAQRDTLFLRENQPHQDNSGESYPGQFLYRMNPDGSERTQILRIADCWLGNTFAGNEQYLYFLTDFYDAETDMDRFELNRLDYHTGEHRVLTSFDQWTNLIGAYDQTLLLELSNGQDMIAATEADIVQYDLSSGEQTPVFHYTMKKPLDAHTIVYADDATLYIVEPNGEKTAKLTRRDLCSESEKIVTEKMSYFGYHDNDCFEAFFAENQMLLISMEDGNQKMFAVNVQTGEETEITLSTMTEVGSVCYPVLGSTQKNFVCQVDASEYAVIAKADYLNSIDNKIVLG